MRGPAAVGGFEGRDAACGKVRRCQWRGLSGPGHVTSCLCAFLRSNSRAVAGPAREAILPGRAGAALAYGSSTSSSLPHLCGIHTGGPVGDVQGTRRLQQNHCPCRRQAQGRTSELEPSLQNWEARPISTLPVLLRCPCVYELKEQGDSPGPSNVQGARGYRIRLGDVACRVWAARPGRR